MIGTSTDGTKADVIPVVDISSAITGDPAARELAAQALVDACRRVGFVYIVGHPIDSASLDAAFALSKALFDLSAEEKMKAPHPPGGAVHRGYSYPGLEKVSQETRTEAVVVEALRQVKDCKVSARMLLLWGKTYIEQESYEIGSEDDDEQPNVWLPDGVLPGFKEFTTEFYWRCFGTAREILKLIARGIGLQDEEFFLKYHSGNYNQLRLLHYPPVAAEEIESQRAARMPAHTDWWCADISLAPGYRRLYRLQYNYDAIPR